MANDITKVVLDLDNTDFVNKLKESLGLMDDLGNPDGLKNLSETLVEVGSIMGIVAAAGLAIKVAIDLTTEAEKINQVRQSFDALAKSAGLSADVIKEQLVTAAHGLVSEGDLLESANKAIVLLGDNAGKIPEIMELARKATTVFGGDLLTNFDNLSRAMASGNARMLKRYGIIVDATKAEDEYAKSLGVSRDYLDAGGKRLAVMNAALEQGTEKFKDVNENTLQATNALKSITATFKDLGEIAVIVWGKVAGPYVGAALSKLADWLHELKISIAATLDPSSLGFDEYQKHLQDNINATKEQITWNEKAFNTQRVTELNAQLKNQEAELQKINAEHEKKIALDKQNEAQAGDENKGIDTEKLLKARQKFETEIAKIHKDRVDSDLKAETDADTAEAQVHEKSAAIEAAADAKWAQVRKQMMDMGITDAGQLEKARVDIYQKANNEVIQNERSINAERLKALKNLELANQNTAAGITAGFATSGEQAKQNFQNMSKLGSSAFSTLGSNAKSAFEALGNGSKNASDAIRGFMFGAIGDIAEQQGEMMLLMGIWPPNPMAIAAGGALIALGSALKSMGQGSSSPSASGGGASSASSASSTQASQAVAPSPQAVEKKAVTVQIQGNYFETDQTRTRLMEMIRQAGDFTDFNLKQIGQP